MKATVRPEFTPLDSVKFLGHFLEIERDNLCVKVAEICINMAFLWDTRGLKQCIILAQRVTSGSKAENAAYEIFCDIDWRLIFGANQLFLEEILLEVSLYRAEYRFGQVFRCKNILIARRCQSCLWFDAEIQSVSPIRTIFTWKGGLILGSS